MKKFYMCCFAALSMVGAISCNNDDNKDEIAIENPSNSSSDVQFFGLTESNELVSLSTKNVGTFDLKKTITGLSANEKLMSIDFRPATGELYAVSNLNKIYIINTETAVARVLNSTSFSPAISGSIASIDFNPTSDRIRLVTNTGQNIRIHPETGAIAASDLTITNSSSITGIAYSNSFAGAETTTLYDIDVTGGKLFKQDPPNNGSLILVGSLGITFTGQAAFDISPDNGAAIMAASTGITNNVYSVDLMSGKATSIGALSQKLIDIAIPTNPVAYAINNANEMEIFNPNFPKPIKKVITGLQSSELILGLDFRPSNSQLYALGSSSRIYTINLVTGVATTVGTGALSSTLSGTEFGFDINPLTDRIRIVSNLGQNLLVNPNTGAVSTVDTSINPVPAALGAAAYSNNFAGTTSTTLYVIDHNTDKLYTQSATGGTLTSVGSLGINIAAANGFDIGGKSQKAYLLASIGSETKIYTTNLATGSTTSLSTYPNPIKAFAIGLGF